MGTQSLQLSLKMSAAFDIPGHHTITRARRRGPTPEIGDVRCRQGLPHDGLNGLVAWMGRKFRCGAASRQFAADGQNVTRQRGIGGLRRLF